MSKYDKQIAVRLPSELNRRVAEHAARLSDAYGLSVSVSNAMRLLLKEALDAVEAKTSSKERPKKRQTAQRAPAAPPPPQDAPPQPDPSPM